MYPPQSLSELVSIYHDSIGQNANLLLDWTPTPVGTMLPSHVTRYGEFGSYLRGCYGAPVGSTSGAGSVLLLELGGAVIDRVSVREDLTGGQRVRAFVVEGAPAGGSGWVVLGGGESIGNRYIALPAAGAAAYGRVRVNVTVAAAGAAGPPLLELSAYDCTRV